MEYKWNLDTIYPGFNSNEFLSDVKFLEKTSYSFNKDMLKSFSTSKDAVKKIENYLSYIDKINNMILKLSVYCSLKIAEDSNNDEAAAIQEKVVKIRNSFNTASLKFNEYVIAQDSLDELIEQSELLKEHEFYLKEIVKKSSHMLPTGEENLLSEMQVTGSSAWFRLQMNTSSNATMKINVDGKEREIPVTALNQLPKAKSKEEKLERFHAECHAYAKHADISARCLNSIKGEVLTITKARKYKSPLEMTLNDCKLTEKALDALIESIEDYLPKLREYYSTKAKVLGYEKGLPFYEISTPVGNSTQKFTIEEAKKEVIEAYYTFSDELGEFAQNAFRNEWVDFLPRYGKRSGAFCSSCHSVGECRVLTNFNGGFKDVNTLAHELGHGFHGKQLVSEKIVNCSYPMPLAETASTFCEEVLKKNLIKKIDEKDMLAFMDFSILSPTQVTVDILSRFYFEKSFFKVRRDHPLSVDEINKLMLKAQKKAYGNSIDKNTFCPYMWLNKVHYYYASRNYYNFPYAFGLLFSLGLHSIYEEKGEDFVKEYNNLLKSTGKMSIKDVCAIVGIDCESKEFWYKSLDKIVAKIDLFKELAEKEMNQR